MKIANLRIIFLFLLLITAFGCGKPEDKLVGTWNNVKTPSSIEFKKDHTGVILQKTNPNLPPSIPFKWSMAKDKEFLVEVPAHGQTAQAHGRLEKDDTMLLDTDTFRKAK